MANGLLAKNGIIVTGSIEVQNAVTASAFSGDGSALTNTPQTDISALNTFTGSIQTQVDTLETATGSYATTSSVDALVAATSSYLTSIPSTYLNTTAYTTETISKSFNYTSSLNITEFTSSVESVIMDYRLTNLNSGSRAGTFIYTHNGTDLNYVDSTVEGVGNGNNPILSATLTGSIVSIDIENAAGFNFSGFAKKFSKLDSAVLEANPNISYLLDDPIYNDVEAAYSVRQLGQLYTGAAMRIREDGTNTETDIGFNINGGLDTTAISTHCGVNNGYVVTWYDQSGNSNNATQTTGSLQPQIYNGSNVITASSGSVTSPALKFIDNGDKLVFDNSFTYKTYAVTYANNGRAQITSPNYTSARTGNGGIGYRFYSFEIGGGSANKVINGIDFTGVINDSTFNGWTGHSAVQANQELHIFVVNATKTPTAIGNEESSNNAISEIIFFSGTARNTTEQINLSNTINQHYNLYPEGFLYTYENSAAAYSVRQLSGNATNCINIRRASDDAEQNIGFTSNGDLDTGSIETFCTGTTCYVDTWYDQSGNGLHASQSNAAYQPLIYTSNAVITKGGKAALQAADASSMLDIGSPISFNDFSMVLVFEQLSGRMLWGVDTFYYYYNKARLNVVIGLTGATNNGAHTLDTFNRSGSAVEYTVNGTLANTASNSTLYKYQKLFNAHSQTFGHTAPYQEFILWDFEQSSSISDIQANVNSYYNIY